MTRDQEIAALQQRLDADTAGVVRMNPAWRRKTERRLAALSSAGSGTMRLKRTQWLALLSLFYGLAGVTLLDIFDPQPRSFLLRIAAALVLAALVYGSMLKRTAKRMAREAIINQPRPSDQRP